jgi:hypothetical protein
VAGKAGGQYGECGHGRRQWEKASMCPSDIENAYVNFTCAALQRECGSRGRGVCSATEPGVPEQGQSVRAGPWRVHVVQVGMKSQLVF